MASKNSQSETIKEAVTAATRAISGNKEIDHLDCFLSEKKKLFFFKFTN